ncbi:protein NDH-DEPENDENT CYCLIC ELECTRON FLOW 5 [Primulina eburnea]|uniref:protein NDH-DEPENDENT CYCLIC ELECTRON FLOW 5 n=1 Tax=Primulina eburnea TaxID=1245227 RepID=UPI003C6BDCBF
MAISYRTCLSFLNSISIPVTKPEIKSVSLHSYNDNKRGFALPVVAISTGYQQIDVGYLETKFGSQEGVSFSSIGDEGCVMRMRLKNGSSTSLMLPSGLITSFKAAMWHGGSLELLHTSVSASDNGDGDEVSVRGGLSLDLSCEDDAGVSWSPNAWNLNKVKGTPRDSIQVELVSNNTSEGGGEVEVKHIITLGEEFLTSEVLVSNSSNSSSLQLMGSIISHLTLSTPEATYAIGLQRSDFVNKPPLLSGFSLIPPEFIKRDGSKDTSNYSGLRKLFPNWVAKNQDGDVESMTKSSRDELDDSVQEEDDDYKHLAMKISRIYTNTPRNFTIIDRGRRNSVTLERYGFKELYVFSPGSGHELYGKYSYVCIGNAALLEPIILKAGSEWRGGLSLSNPNS